MISAKVVAHSVGKDAPPIASIQVTCHRFILAELNTHRVFSRNYRSSRAVPVKKLLEEVRTNPAMPVHWGSNKPGMQAGEELSPSDRQWCVSEWLLAARNAATTAEKLMQHGLHKQVANRVLEPFLYVHGIITSTEWENFFGLRCHPDAQPEIRVLAEAMRDALAASTPVMLGDGYWHRPYVTDEDSDKIGVLCHKARDYDYYLNRISAARCARVSYKMHDGTAPNVEADLALAEKLMTAKPGHWSPMEHQATPDAWLAGYNFGEGCWSRPQHQRNFTGWKQFRAMSN